MGQLIGTRIEVLGTLVCRGPVHVGGWDHTAEADMTIARDGTGRPCLPGTSIAGALRAYLSGIDRFRRNGPIAALFGHVTPDDKNGSPSWIRVDDAHLIGDDVTLTVRDGVAIDRDSASAAAQFLYTRQALPAGSRFALRLVADTPIRTDAPDYPGGWAALVNDAVNAMVGGLTNGRVPIGARRGSGFGQVELRDVRIRRVDLSDPAGLVAWLTGAVPTTAATFEDKPADGRLQVTVHWRPLGPLLVRDSLSGAVVDTLPLTDITVDGAVRLLLPGSSIRGAVRAYAERIVRTLRRQPPPEDFKDGLTQPPPGVDVLFGAAPPRRRDERNAAAGETTDAEFPDKGWRGVLSVADCHSVGQISAEQWQGIVSVTPDAVDGSGKEKRKQREELNFEREEARAALHKRLTEINDTVPLNVSDHVAIDRWTGGAADHRLFSVLDPDATVAWEPFRIEVDVARLDRHRGVNESTELALPLLLLVLRDLRDGWLSLGYGGTRGRGQIEVTDVTFDGAGLTGPWQSLVGQTLESILADPPPAVSAVMATWEQTIQEAAA